MHKKHLYLNRFVSFSYLTLLLAFTSCKYYKQDILLNYEGEEASYYASQEEDRYIKNYIIQPFDDLSFKLFTSKGEVLVDPTGKMKEFSATSTQENTSQQVNMMNPSSMVYLRKGFIVNEEGYVDLPIVGSIKVGGKRFEDLDSIFKSAYKPFYGEDIYLEIKPLNNYVFIVKSGAVIAGGGGMGGNLTLLPREGMNVLEVIALSGGLPEYSKADKIRVYRKTKEGDKLFIVDLSSLEGVKKTNLNVQPKDIIYIEPGRRPAFESTKDFQFLFTSIFSTLLTITTVVLLRNK